jgi:hypothetical protein
MVIAEAFVGAVELRGTKLGAHVVCARARSAGGVDGGGPGGNVSDYMYYSGIR